MGKIPANWPTINYQRSEQRTSDSYSRTITCCHNARCSKTCWFPCWPMAWQAPEQQDMARQLLDRVGLSDRLTHRPAELSGGERQRVAIARALVRQPTLLLADEPTGNLDQATGQQVTELLIDLHQQQNSILIAVTHSTQLAAAMQQQHRLELGQLIGIK